MSGVKRAFFGPRRQEAMTDAEIECDITLQVIRHLQRTNPAAQMQVLKHVIGFLDRVNHGRFEIEEDEAMPNFIERAET